MNIPGYIETAAELAIRFSDLRDFEVVSHVADVHGLDIDRLWDTVHERVMLAAYNGVCYATAADGVAAGTECAQAWGILPKAA